MFTLAKVILEEEEGESVAAVLRQQERSGKVALKAQLRPQG